jgi:pimeloyl-ACP methyl ester carboxylesterase
MNRILISVALLVALQTATAADQVALTPCQRTDIPGAMCGTFEVYENRVAKSGRKIPLNIIVLPASGPNRAPDPVFWLDGGPGVGATRVAPAGIQGFLSVLHPDHDLVFVDSRGTGKSKPLTCSIGDDPANLPQFFGPLFPLDAIRSCRQTLEKNADLRLYTTPIAMDDLDDVREALGYDKIDIVGASYGTIAAQVFMRQHPEHVRAVFLTGVGTPGLKQPLPFPRGAQHALDLLFVDCAADAHCSEAFPHLKDEFAALLSRFDAGPIEVRLFNPGSKQLEPIKLERDNFVERMRLFLYTTTFGSFVPLIIHKAYENDFIPFETLAIRYNPGSLLSRGEYLTVTCSESVQFITPREVRREAKHSFVGDRRITSHIAACKEWPRGDIPASFTAPVKSTLPVLMFSGELDASTPPWLGKVAVRFLPNGKQVNARYYGHQTDSQCMLDVMRNFIAAASVKDLDTSCAEKIRRPPFPTEIPAPMSLR